MAESTAGVVTVSPLAGQPAPRQMLVDLTRLEQEYYARKLDMRDPNQRVVFGTSGHRGSSLTGAITEAHIAAITQAICEYRRGQGIDGPLYLGKDTHALSEPAQRTALQVLVANGVETLIQRDQGVTPTPVISRAILAPHGGPADTDVTQWPEERANALLRDRNVGVRRVPHAKASASIGGLKVVSRGWFAARPSGTENVYKIYAESFVGASHLDAIVAEARAIVDTAMGSAA